MNSWEKIPIGEIFSLEKGSLQSTKCTPGDYTFITASSEWKTHNEYSHDCEALVYAVAASGSLGRCHHYSGKFISSDLCFILRAKDEKKHPINYRFYQNVFRFLKDDIVAKTKAGTSKESISQKRFAAYKLPYIDIEHQSFWENKLNNLNDKIENFEVESSNQSTYLTKLRQAILQEAIEGKLTADWRKENHFRKGDPDYDAEALLEKIKAEKEKLIKEGKIKKQKPLAPIKAEEVPFELPEGWVWTRLGEICSKITDGFHNTPPKKTTGVPYIAATHVNEDFIDWSNCHYVDETYHKELFFKAFPKKGELLVVNIGAGCGPAAIIDVDFEFSFKNTAILKFAQELIKNKYLLFYFILNRPEIYSDLTKGGLQPFLSLSILNRISIPLPAFAEQQAIVDRVEKLLTMVDELEDQVSERKEQSEQLMQAVLREAFEGGK
jgi:type I restriction enzyme S subunit